MALLALLLVVVVLAAMTAYHHHVPQSAHGGPLVRVYTHNVRYATAAPSEGEEAWPVRAPRSISEARYHTRGVPAALICLQEVLHMQLVDFVAGLTDGAGADGSRSRSRGAHGRHARAASEWAYVGVGRDDGKQAGEYSPIFYRPAVYRLETSETVWLSPTPTVPSKGWGAGSVRIVTVAVLTHRASGKTILALNTHLDDRSARARQEGAKIILATVARYAAGSIRIDAVVLAGDLNSEAHQEAYQTLTGADSPLLDVHALVPPVRRYGHTYTFTGFTAHDTPSRIDYILAGPRHAGHDCTVHSSSSSSVHDLACADEEKQPATTTSGTAGPWDVHGYTVLPNRFDDRVYNSDHRAVVADLAL